MLVFLFLLQNYIWPTEASKLLTSSFSEPRENRYHTGIDIRTYNKTGYKCFAVEDGYVYRIMTSVYGYGKVIYFKLDDGNIAVYAHLESFNRKLNSFVKNYQLNNGKYDSDIWFKKNQFRYKKGDILAYTGSTGVGTPHLHFEIRKNMNTAINPLEFYPKFKDVYRPEVLELAAIPTNDSSLVNGKQVIEFIPLMQINDSIFEAETWIKLTGEMGLSLNTFDRTSYNQIKTGLQSAKLYLNDSLIFSTDHEAIQFAYNRNSNFDTNLFINKNHQEKFKNLFYPREFKTSKDHSNNRQAIISSKDLTKAFNHFEAHLFDFKKNKLIVRGTIYKKERQLIDDQVTKQSRLDEEVPYLFNKQFVRNGELVGLDSLFDFTLVRDTWHIEQKNQISLGRFQIEMPSNALYEDLDVYLMNLPEALLSDEFRFADIVQFLPNDLFARRVFKVKSTTALEAYENFYSWNASKKKWDFIDSEKDRDGLSYFTKQSFQIYAIIKDSVKPIIYNRIRKNKKGDLLFRVDDKLSGIEDENNFEIYQNGIKLIGEYDFETKTIKVDKFFLGKSKSFKVTLRDNAGNELSKTLRLK